MIHTNTIIIMYEARKRGNNRKKEDFTKMGDIS